MALRPLAVATLVLALALAGCGASPASGSSSPATSSQGGHGGNATTTPPKTNTTSPPVNSTGPRAVKTLTINITGTQFVLGSLTIQANDTVHWVHKDGMTAHTVTDDGGAFDSDTNCMAPGIPLAAVCMVNGETFDHKYTQPGSFPYHCKVHAGMKNTITVVAKLPA